MLKLILKISFFIYIFFFIIFMQPNNRGGFFMSFSVKDLQDQFLFPPTVWEQLKIWDICKKIHKKKGLSQLSIFICHMSDILAS